MDLHGHNIHIFVVSPDNSHIHMTTPYHVKPVSMVHVEKKYVIYIYHGYKKRIENSSIIFIGMYNIEKREEKTFNTHLSGELTSLNFEEGSSKISYVHDGYKYVITHMNFS